MCCMLFIGEAARCYGARLLRLARSSRVNLSVFVDGVVVSFFNFVSCMCLLPDVLSFGLVEPFAWTRQNDMITTSVDVVVFSLRNVVVKFKT